jgi:HlyD family secretion protein
VRSATPAASRSGSRVTRRHKIIAVAVLVVGVPTVAVVLGSNIGSPLQQDAKASPPRTSLITATVVKKVLQQTVVASGSAKSASTTNVRPALSDKAGTPSPILVISALGLSVGQTVAPGSVLVQISGRPIIALPGSIPAYRNLSPGSDGPDVQELQTALDQLGYSTVGDTPGTFGLATENAVRELYNAKGYSAPLTGASAEYNISTALQALQAAQLQLSLTSPKAKRNTAQYQEAVASAQATYDHLLDTTGVMVPRSEIVYVAQFPAVVTTSGATLGKTLKKQKAPLMTLSAGAVTVSETVPADQVSFVHVGSVASIAPATGGTVSGQVFAVGKTLVTSGSVKGYTVLIGGSTLTSSLVAQTLQVTITSAATPKPVLAVPVSAVYSTSSGTPHVTRLLKGGKTKSIAVKVGVSANGFVQVIPYGHRGLRAGNEVVVGSGDDSKDA